MKQSRVASFFSGIGGFDLGFQNAGIDLVYQCEIDDFCNSLLERHWPNVERAGDIREVDNGKEVPEAELWCAGFPCQDVSLARARYRAGLNGRHTSLFYDFARLLDDARPEMVLLETYRVFFLPTAEETSESFSVHWTNSGMVWRGECLTADSSASPNRAEDSTLLDIVETRPEQPHYYLSPNAAQGILRRADAQGRNLFSPFKESLGDPSVGPVVQRLAYCLAATSGRHTGTDWSRTYVTYRDAVRRITPLEAERLQGFPDGWTVPNGLTPKELRA